MKNEEILNWLRELERDPHKKVLDDVDTVLQEIKKEREFQLAQWGDQHHENDTGGDYFKSLETLIKEKNDSIEDPSWSSILLEEVYETVAEEDPEEIKKELIQVAAVCISWIQDLNRGNVV